jgi:tetrahydromethanopterin S-methyltransferase subunit C
MGVIAATVVLSLAGRLEGNIAGAILSGIVGYVLGHLASRGENRTDKSDEGEGLG